MSNAGSTHSGRGALGRPKALLKRPFNALQEHLDVRADIIEERLELLERRVEIESARVIDAGRHAFEDLSDIHLALEDLQRLSNSPPWARLIGADLEELDDLSAAFLNYAGSTRGFAAQAGLEFNPPMRIAYRSGHADLSTASSQLVEVPYAYGALHRLRPGSSVLHLDGAHSLMPYALASLGHHVSVVAADYPVAHPLLTVVPRGTTGPGSEAQRFDGIVATSVASVFAPVKPATEQHGPVAAADPIDWGSLKTFVNLGLPHAVLVLCFLHAGQEGGEASASSVATSVASHLNGWTALDAVSARQVAPNRWDVDDGSAAIPGDFVAMLTFVRSNSAGRR